MVQKLLIGAAFILCSVDVVAQTQLPYIGPEATTCNIKVPEGDLSIKDAGYLTSEDCKTVYVLPPVEGQFNFGAQGVTSLWDTKMCGIINKTFDQLVKLQEASSSADVEETESFVEKMASLKRKLNLLSGEESVLSVAGSATLNWNQLVSEYSRLNPSPIVVKKMPISVGIISTSIYSNDKYASVQAGAGHNRLRVQGLEMPEDFEGIGNMPVPDYIKKLKVQEASSNVIMGDGIGFELDLNLKGACAFLENKSYSLAGTYTYFYPVQTKSVFKVAFNSKELKSDIFALAKARGGNITENELRQAIAKTQSTEISLNPGVYGDKTEDLRKRYEDKLTKMVLENLLSIVSRNLNVAIDNAKYMDSELRAERRCSSSWFGLSKSCHTHYYYVNIQRINWVLVEKQVNDMIESVTGKAESYVTFYSMGTSAIIPAARN